MAAAQDIILRYDEGGSVYDVRVMGSDLAGDASLGTAVLVSLFTDARAEADELPPEYDDPRGFWGDALAETPLGSRLWTLYRSKQTPAVAAAAERYAREALQWLIDEGYATSVDVQAQSAGIGRLEMTIAVTQARPSLLRRAAQVWRVTIDEDGGMTMQGEEI